MRRPEVTSSGASRAQAIGRQPHRTPDGAPVHYERHRPEQTTLYRLVQQHAATFFADVEVATGGDLPQFVKYEFDPSFGEQMRQISLKFVATAIPSRQVAVIRKSKLIINPPGLPKSIAETLQGLTDTPGIFAAAPIAST